ncbi:MAG: hypothetical protein IJP43_06215 [Oscillospiraceae bacterium]|nr:hypothetical protein [Oscillospiraceae bacterium]
MPLTVNIRSPERVTAEIPERKDNVEVNLGSTRVITAKDYEVLDNKPQINGVELIGDKTSEDIKEFYRHDQLVASAEWTISHNMGKYPSVSIVDSGGNVVMGDVRYIDENTVTVRFNGAFSGTAYLN